MTASQVLRPWTPMSHAGVRIHPGKGTEADMTQNRDVVDFANIRPPDARRAGEA